MAEESAITRREMLNWRYMMRRIGRLRVRLGNDLAKFYWMLSCLVGGIGIQLNNMVNGRMIVVRMSHVTKLVGRLIVVLSVMIVMQIKVMAMATVHENLLVVVIDVRVQHPERRQH